jgi:hydroxyacylglutathione hydrolase
MILELIKSEGTSHNSYFLGSGNDAIVIDPRRDCQAYVDTAQQKGLKIKSIFETHRHEDFVVGSIELKNMTGAEIYHGPGLNWKYGTTLKDKQAFRLGDLELTAIHTPGHTDESMCYIVTDLATGKLPVMIFTGDTLFVGDVGRTDLYGEKEAARLAGSLYESVFNQLLPLGDGVIIYPGHGGGSVCGMHIANRDQSTIGIERAQNPVLQIKSKEDFIKYKLAEKPERPPYFTRMEKYNLEGPPLLGCMPLISPLTAREFKQEIDKGAVVVDTSEPADFAGIHIKGSYSIWIEGLPAFAGWILPYDKPIILVLEAHERPELAARYLLRSGYDQVQGFLKGGIETWYNAGFAVESMGILSVHQLKSILDRRESLTIIDTRGDEEWKSGHIEGALHIYVGHLEQRLSEIPRDKPVVVYCKTGRRAGLSASILLRGGFSSVYNVPGSVTAWVAAGFPLTTK